jgi:WD repeat-containing protein 68
MFIIIVPKIIHNFRLALGSFVEEYNNKVQIVSLDEDTSEFSAKSTFDHPYPTTKIMWIPDSVSILQH